MTTITYPQHEAIVKLQGLIEVNIDSARGFRLAAEKIEDPSLSGMFRREADARDAHAAELQSLVSRAGETPVVNGSVSGLLHRWWLDLRGAVTKNAEHAMLCAAERGEDVIRRRYEDCLQEPLGDPLSGVVMRQYEHVKQSHDHVRTLRDRPVNGR